MGKKYFCYFFIFVFVSLVINCHTALAAAALGIDVKDGKEILQLSLKNTQPTKVFTVQNPERLVVDVPVDNNIKKIFLPEGYKGKLIKNVRAGNFDTKTSRIVFELNAPVRVLSKKSFAGILAIEISAAQAATIQQAKPDNKDLKASASKSEKVDKAVKVENTTQKSKWKRDEPPKKPMIVIDAGHGGPDSGTIGDSGTYEKDVVLEYAQTLKAKLLAEGKYRVLLTREDDHFIPLRGRVAIARKAGASLFISIHADSAGGEEARGLSVYTVSEQASDKEAEALAARENKSDIIGGMDLSDERPEVADILISLAQRETKNNSAMLADLLVLALGDRVKLLPNTHRFAGFAVLKAPDIPSVLIEVGFLSHPKEEKELKTKKYRDKVVSGIMAGIDRYFAKKTYVQISQ